MNKYRMTSETLEYKGRTLRRIRALKEFGDVKIGDLGGFVESENNLSQEGDCWIYDDAKVWGNAKVSINARIYDKAEVYGDAKIWDNVEIFGKAKVFGKAEVYYKAKIFENARVFGWARIFDEAEVFGEARVNKGIIAGDTKKFSLDIFQYCGI